MRKLALLMIPFLACSCENPGASVMTTKNFGAYNVELLFEVDQCKVYRFHDDGKKYFTNCVGAVEWEQQSGKTHFHESIQGGKHDKTSKD